MGRVGAEVLCMRTVTTGGSTEWMTAARWRSADARAALRALAESGESVTRFAARHGIASHRLYGWRRRLSTASPAGATPVFVELSPAVIGRAGAGGFLAFEIVLTTGDTVRVPSRFDDVALRRVLAAVRGGGSW